MLSWVVTFLVIALIAGILGFGGIAGASVEIAKAIFFIAVILFLISAVVGLVRGRTGFRHVQRGSGAGAGSVVGRRRLGTPCPRAILEPARVGDVTAAVDAVNGIHVVAPIWLGEPAA